jgi:hypothetical protein
MRKTQWNGGAQPPGTPPPAQTPGLTGGSAGSIDSRAGGEALRDLDQQSLSSVKIQLLPPLEAVYAEPFYLALKAEPTGGILCLRCISSVSDKPVTCGGMVHFVWEAEGSRARITSIDGLSSGKYKFTFLVVG